MIDRMVYYNENSAVPDFELHPKSFVSNFWGALHFDTALLYD